MQMHNGEKRLFFLFQANFQQSTLGKLQQGRVYLSYFDFKTSHMYL